MMNAAEKMVAWFLIAMFVLAIGVIGLGAWAFVEIIMWITSK